MIRTLFVGLALTGLFVACGGKAPAPAPTPAAADAATPAPTPTPTPTPTETATPEPSDTAPVQPKSDVVAPTPVADTGQDWLVWYGSDKDGFRTRWLRTTGATAEVVAEKKAPFLSDGASMWRLERRDSTHDVTSCDCLDDEENGCGTVATLVQPGLVAVDLETAAVTKIRTADEGPMMGGDINVSLDLSGGRGAKLFLWWTESGYFCGAHPMQEGAHVVFDVPTGEALAVQEGLKKALPDSVKLPAAKEILPLLKDCEDEPDMTVADAVEQMAVDNFSVSLDASGAVKVAWGFAAFVAYACSADYLSTGGATSGLLPQASAVGLNGPLAPGLAKAFADIGATPTVGWSKLVLVGPARDRALAAFKASPEPAWPSGSFNEKLVPTAAPKDNAEALANVRKGQKLTRAKSYDEAIGAFSAAIASAPKLARAYSGRGYAKLLKGEYDAARTDFEKARELTTPEDTVFHAQIWFNLGQIAERKADKATARTAYEKSLKLRPNEAVERALARVRAE